jgi:hypothetical protein
MKHAPAPKAEEAAVRLAEVARSVVGRTAEEEAAWVDPTVEVAVVEEANDVDTKLPVSCGLQSS